MKVYKIKFLFFAEIEKKKKTLKLSENVNSFMLRFSCNDENQRYYVNGM